MTEAEVQRLMGLHEAAYMARAAYVFERGSLKSAEDASTALESALREALQPAGWRLVPVEPTPEMVTAGMDGLGSCVGSCGEASPPDRADIADSYRAMLSAAPTTAPAAPEVPADARDARYRLLERDEPLRADDESLSDDCMTWNRIGWLYSKCTYRPGFFLPIRRRVDAAMAAPTPQEPKP